MSSSFRSAFGRFGCPAARSWHTFRHNMTVKPNRVCMISSASVTSSARTSITVNHKLHRDINNISQTQRFFRTSPSVLSEAQVINVPGFADSISEGDVKIDRQVGDVVQEDEVVCEIETDKTSVPVPAPFAGVIEEILVEDGDTVQPGQALFKLKPADGSADTSPKPAAAAPTPTPAAPVKSAPPPPAAAPTPSAPVSGSIPTTMPPVTPLPSGPMSMTPASEIRPIAVPEGRFSEAAEPIDARTETRVKMSRMRQRIAQRLKDAQNVCAMLTTFNEIDMTNIMEMRNMYKDEFFKKYGQKLGFMSAFVKASAFALQAQPVVNAVIDGNEVVYRDYIDISVAVSTPKGLVVPVLRDVGPMNFADVELGIAALGEKARTNDLAVEDMDGGTFTISNGGVFGSLIGTPIINPPQSAILGMHSIVKRPVAIGNNVEIRPMMYVALTYDHRLIDGREAVTFLRKVKSAVEDPRVILVNI